MPAAAPPKARSKLGVGEKGEGEGDWEADGDSVALAGAEALGLGEPEGVALPVPVPSTPLDSVADALLCAEAVAVAGREPRAVTVPRPTLALWLREALSVGLRDGVVEGEPFAIVALSAVVGVLPGVAEALEVSLEEGVAPGVVEGLMLELCVCDTATLPLPQLALAHWLTLAVLEALPSSRGVEVTVALSRTPGEPVA